MARFELFLREPHVLSLVNTRANGWLSRPGGWATIPLCSCGWNRTGWAAQGDTFVQSPRGSMFSDHYPTPEDATKRWLQDHMENVDPDARLWRLTLRLVDPPKGPAKMPTLKR